ncbi:MAG: hypothetical protein AMK72_11025 [Planctomycetes bacterium SM23_25]|nr:MAG: hypothetical protein AMK72_11025 [Planctomycetes bacterium SM23_25]
MGYRIMRMCNLCFALLGLGLTSSGAEFMNQDEAKPLRKAVPEFRGQRNADGSWGLVLSGAGMASAEQRKPLKLEVWDETKGSVRTISGGYKTMAREGAGWTGAGRLTLGGGVSFAFEDRWQLRGDVLRLDRTVRVHGKAAGGFLSAAVLDVTARQRWPEVEWFAPGMIYGGFANLTDTAIGGRAHYRPSDFSVRIREDRLPAPLMLARFEDGSSLAVLNPAPRGDTTAADANDVKAVPMVDERFQFGAIGAEERGKALSLGYWYPGSEGEVTYAGNTYPGGPAARAK